MFCFGKIIFKKALAYSETELYFPVTFIIWNEITVLSYPLFHPRRLPLTPKLTLTQTQTLTLTGAQFSSGAICWLSTNPKTNSNLDPDPNPNPNRGQFFLRRGGGEQSSGHRLDFFSKKANNLMFILLTLVRSY